MPPTLKTVPDGLLVCFEGIDGTGKTTQLQSAAEHLSEQGWLVKSTRALGGTPIGEALRQVSFESYERPAATNLYIAQAIYEALLIEIENWRAQGAIILMDRGPLSTAGYQIFGDKLDSELGWRTVDANLKRLKIDLIILYTVPVATAFQRLSNKPDKADYFESKPAEYFESVQAGYLQAAQKYGAHTIDGQPQISTIESMTQQLIDDVLQAKLGC